MLKYVGNVPSSSSARRKLLQSSSGTDVYFNIQNVRAPFFRPAVRLPGRAVRSVPRLCRSRASMAGGAVLQCAPAARAPACSRGPRLLTWCTQQKCAPPQVQWRQQVGARRPRDVQHLRGVLVFCRNRSGE